MPSPPVTPPDFRQHLLVETPEHVTLDYEIAGIGSRALAALADTGLLMLWLSALALATGLLLNWSSSIAPIFYVATSFLSIWGYFALFEGLRNGQTPGKRMLGLRVVLDTGHPVTLSAALLRNLIRAADFLPPPYFLGAVMVGLHPRAKRLGDLVAGTVVVRDRPLESAAVIAPRAAPALTAGPPRLAEAEFRLLAGFQARAPGMTPAARRRLAASLFARLGTRSPELGGTEEQILEQLLEDETNRRAGVRAGGPTGRGSAGRLIDRQRPRWTAFGKVAERAARGGLDGFAATELPTFAAAYREVAADLARARTYQADAATLAELERLVAAGHNVLYRDNRKTLRRIWLVISRECPAAVLRSRRTVYLALLAFWLPALTGFVLLRSRPALAEELLPEAMLSRADAGVARRQAGQGYYEAESGQRPLMAAEIITNNVQVAFICFAGGIFLGVGALISLAFNGLMLGASAGHFANRGLLDYLGRFVIGHGVLELNAICLAGAAGFLLGQAIIAPGDLPRADAIRVAGRTAIRIIGATVVMLLVAGLIEGLVSAGTSSWAERLTISATSAVWLVLYLLNGRRADPEPPPAIGAVRARSSPA